MNISKVIFWIVKLVVAGILLQTLYFKFTAHPDSVYIFEQTGLGTPGRIATGVAELFAAVLLIIPRTTWIGAVLAIGIISGAIFYHLTSLGIEVQNDEGFLFKLAMVVWIGSVYIFVKSRDDIPFIPPRKT